MLIRTMSQMLQRQAVSHPVLCNQADRSVFDTERSLLESRCVLAADYFAFFIVCVVSTPQTKKSKRSTKKPTNAHVQSKKPAKTAATKKTAAEKSGEDHSAAAAAVSSTETPPGSSAATPLSRLFVVNVDSVHLQTHGVAIGIVAQPYSKPPSSESLPDINTPYPVEIHDTICDDGVVGLQQYRVDSFVAEHLVLRPHFHLAAQYGLIQFRSSDRRISHAYAQDGVGDLRLDQCIKYAPPLYDPPAFVKGLSHWLGDLHSEEENEPHLLRRVYVASSMCAGVRDLHALGIVPRNLSLRDVKFSAPKAFEHTGVEGKYLKAFQEKVKADPQHATAMGYRSLIFNQFDKSTQQRLEHAKVNHLPRVYLTRPQQVFLNDRMHPSQQNRTDMTPHTYTGALVPVVSRPHPLNFSATWHHGIDIGTTTAPTFNQLHSARQFELWRRASMFQVALMTIQIVGDWNWDDHLPANDPSQWVDLIRFYQAWSKKNSYSVGKFLIEVCAQQDDTIKKIFDLTCPGESFKKSFMPDRLTTRLRALHRSFTARRLECRDIIFNATRMILAIDANERRQAAIPTAEELRSALSECSVLDSDDAIAARIKAFGLRRQGIAPDGDCVLDAFRVRLLEEEDLKDDSRLVSIAALRASVHQRLQSMANDESLLNFFPEIAAEKDLPSEDHKKQARITRMKAELAKLQHDHEWNYDLGDAILSIMCTMFKTHVRVVVECGDASKDYPIGLPTGESAHNILMLKLRDSRHYDALMPLRTESSQASATGKRTAEDAELGAGEQEARSQPPPGASTD